MIVGSLGRRYTKALFGLARENEQEEAVGGEIEQFLAVYTGSPLETVLNNPAFELDQRRKILRAVATRLPFASVRTGPAELSAVHCPNLPSNVE
jgi:F0F1-type ATP synthase delta subunit